MAWARLDDNFHDHPKVDELDLAAVGLFTLTLTWAHRHAREAKVPGLIRAARVRKVAGADADALAAQLVEAGLWDQADDGWLIHDFADYLPRQRDPEERREAGRRGGLKSAETRAATLKSSQSKQVATSNEAASLEPASPLVDAPPSNPEPNPSSRAGARARPVPDSSTSSPTGDAVAAASKPVSVNSLVAEFVDQCQTRPPGAIIGRIGKSVKSLLDQDQSPETIRAALTVMATKALPPSALPGVVHEVANRRQPARYDDSQWDGRTGTQDLSIFDRKEAS